MSKPTNFKITGPGFYKTRDGRKVEIRLHTGLEVWAWRTSDYETYMTDGRYTPGGCDSDIVGVWEEEPEWDGSVNTGLKVPSTQYHKTSEYMLELVSERFRALGWSLIPLKRTLTTKLWVYDASDGDAYLERTEYPNSNLGRCLGAIEGSELITEELV